jgi:hypothetical protein
MYHTRGTPRVPHSWYATEGGPSVPVTGYVGLPGSGKTLRLVQLAAEARAAGRDVYANFRLGSRRFGYLVPTCPWRPAEPEIACLGIAHESHEPDGYRFEEPTIRWDAKAQLYGLRAGRAFVPDPGVTTLTSWEQVVAIRVARDEFGVAHRLRLVFGGMREDKDGPEEIWTAEPTCNVWRCSGCSNGITIALDELNLWAPSRFWAKLGIGVLTRFAYVRKDGLELLWSAQHEARIDKVAREVTDFIWSCKSYGGIFTVFRRWSLHLQLFHRRKWIPALMTDRNRVTEGEGAKANGIFGLDFQMAFWWGAMAAAAEKYDTYEHVGAIAQEARDAEGGRASLTVLASQGSALAGGQADGRSRMALTSGGARGPRSRSGRGSRPDLRGGRAL